MTVGELQRFLKKFNNDTEILYIQCSDYNILEAEHIELIKAVPKDFYVMRSHPTMSEENKSKEKEFLVFQGN